MIVGIEGYIFFSCTCSNWCRVRCMMDALKACYFLHDKSGDAK